MYEFALIGFGFVAGAAGALCFLRFMARGPKFTKEQKQAMQMAQAKADASGRG